MADTIHIAGICGSLRKASYNAMALRAAAELAPGRVEIDIIRLHGIPLYDQDVEDQGWPAPVAALRERVGAADGVLFAMPEYNYAIPGVLKNAVDWLSRGDAPPIYGKPAAMLGASTSIVGTARAQAHMRDVAFYNAMPLLPTAEVLLFRAGEKFDDEGRLTDEDSRGIVADMMEKFVEWIVRVNG